MKALFYTDTRALGAGREGDPPTEIEFSDASELLVATECEVMSLALAFDLAFHPDHVRVVYVDPYEDEVSGVRVLWHARTFEEASATYVERLDDT